MKRIFLVTCIAFLSISTKAQTSFGVQAGANFATVKTDDDDGVKSKVGLVIGALADIDFGSSISFRPELNFIQKGFKYDEAGYEESLTLNYIELAPNFVYNITAGSGKVFFGLGPSFAFGVSGKAKSKSGNFPEEKEDIDFGSDDDQIKSFDYGFTVLGGYKLANGLFLSAGYNLGLGNLSNFDGDEFESKNRGFNIKIGYMFGNNRNSGE
jgi:hypothetical protein